MTTDDVAGVMSLRTPMLLTTAAERPVLHSDDQTTTTITPTTVEGCKVNQRRRNEEAEA